MNIIEFTVADKDTINTQQIEQLIHKYNGVYTRKSTKNGIRYSVQFDTNKLKESFNKDIDNLLPASFNYWYFVFINTKINYKENWCMNILKFIMGIVKDWCVCVK